MIEMEASRPTVPNCTFQRFFPRWNPPPGRMSLGTWVVKPGRVRQRQPSLVGLPRSNESSNRNSWPYNWEPAPWTSLSWRWYLDFMYLPFTLLTLQPQWSSWGYLHDGQHQQSRQCSEHHQNRDQGDDLEGFKRVPSLKNMTLENYAKSPFSIRDTSSNCFFFSNFILVRRVKPTKHSAA